MIRTLMTLIQRIYTDFWNTTCPSQPRLAPASPDLRGSSGIFGENPEMT